MASMLRGMNLISYSPCLGMPCSSIQAVLPSASVAKPMDITLGKLQGEKFLFSKFNESKIV